MQLQLGEIHSHLTQRVILFKINAFAVRSPLVAEFVIPSF